MQAIDQIQPYELVDIQSTLNDMFIDLQARFSSATDPAAAQTIDTSVCSTSTAFIDKSVAD